MYKIKKIIIIFYWLFYTLPSLAGFGDSCSQLPTTTDGYLEQSTAYGYLIRSIDMKHPGGNCDPNVNSLTFCFKNKEESSTPCTIYTLNENASKKVSELSIDNNPDLGANSILKDITLTVKRTSGDLCLFMPTSRGPMPVACKSLSTAAPTPPPEPECSNIGKSCYMKERRSQSLLGFSGLAVDCLTETLNKVFFRENSCAPDQQNANITNLTAFPIFQGYLKKTVSAALILYVMFFAFNILLNKNYFNTEKIAMFVIKLIFVLYFAIGLGPISHESGTPTQENGMLNHALPLLVGAAPDFAQMVFNAAGSRGLCQFDTAKYPPGYAFYALWDAIDCRIGYYLGMDLLYNINSNIFSGFGHNTSGGGNNIPIPDLGSPDKNSPEALKTIGAFKFFSVMFGFLMAGNFIILTGGLVFIVIFLSILLYFITHYLVCIITIYVMTYISPIFIPMALFQRTKPYFDGWMKVCISCALQPAVVAGFIALLVTMYDSAIYKNCEFLRHDYDKGSVKFSTFELRLPSSSSDVCRESLGYKLLQYYSGQGWEERLVILFPIKFLKDVATILPEILCVLIFSILFYFFSKSIGRFASDITSGPNMDAVTASPTKIVDLVKKGVAFAMDAAQGKPPTKGGGTERKGGEQEGGLGASGGGGEQEGGFGTSGGGK